ncbi:MULTISPECIES: DUF3558 domain-containing protein [unclassified Crossiella]|uniref:DUF3558 domain-containing protein n=1 Tax=unclassified Crossiella TaxID=2620835 RepID=UPI0020004745|nr:MULTISPECIES: DUF3558 domain-containing protein [unclassified Crossiella]MCK2241207.1 DUF3558 domain-containing protein [Crossiella sp. S99.2]MCK2253649.1 DUF3558 domain-containing protein [Crossiella sp. S99.1]
MNRVALSTLAIVGLALVAGCSGGSNSPSTSAQPPTSGAATSTSAAGLAPPITQPKLDKAATFASKPCDLLTAAQYGTVRVSAPGKVGESVLGQECTWRTAQNPNTSVGGSFSVALSTKADAGLNNLYAKRDTYKAFEPATVSGYPSVHANTGTPFGEGDCFGYTSVSDTVTISVGVTVNDKAAAEYKNACGLADKVAEMVISTIKGGS